MPSKRFRNSKTLWLNGLALFAAVTAALVDTDLLKAHPERALYFAAALAVANAALRFFTSLPLGGK